MFKHVTWLLGAVLILGTQCRPAPHTEDPSLSNAQAGIGAGCTKDEDCGGDLTCVKEAPGGFCTKRCTTACDDNHALCVRIGLPENQFENACAPLCETVEDCRQPYQCISVGRVSVCGL